MTEPTLHNPGNTAFLPFTRSHQPLQERILVPAMHTQAIGEIVQAFADLEETIRLGILRLRGSAPTDRCFDSSVALIASLAHQHSKDHRLGLDHVIDLMVGQWKKAKQLRDRALRLPGDSPFRRQVMQNLGTTAAAEEIPDHEFDVGYLLDIAGFIGSVAWNAESFLLDEEQPQPASRPATRS